MNLGKYPKIEFVRSTARKKLSDIEFKVTTLTLKEIQWKTALSSVVSYTALYSITVPKQAGRTVRWSLNLDLYFKYPRVVLTRFLD